MEKVMKTEDGQYIAKGVYTVAYETHEDADYIVYDFAGYRLEEGIDRLVRVLARTPEVALDRVKYEELNGGCELAIWISVDMLKAYTADEVSEEFDELMVEITRTAEMVHPGFVQGAFDSLMDALKE
jgi:hypothetical protein